MDCNSDARHAYLELRVPRCRTWGPCERRRFAERLAQVQVDLEPDVGQMGRLERATNEYLDVAELRHRLSTVHLRASYRHPLLQAV